MAHPSFTLDPRLQQDTHLVCELDLSLVLLAKDARYPWLIVVPKRADLREIFELDQSEQIQLARESERCYDALQTLHKPDKINIAALGNVVSQLHIHHVARFKNDEVWPAPIWGQGDAKQYDEQILQQRLSDFKSYLQKA